MLSSLLGSEDRLRNGIRCNSCLYAQPYRVFYPQFLGISTRGHCFVRIGSCPRQNRGTGPEGGGIQKEAASE